MTGPLVVAVAALAAVVGTVFTLMLWTGRVQAYRDVPSWWPSSAREFWTYLRILPATCLFIWVAVALGAVFATAARCYGCGLPGVANLLLAAMAILFCLIVAVALFNQPRFLVPPWLRGKPGLLDKARGSRTR